MSTMHDEPGPLDEALWRLPTVIDRTGLSEAEILRRERDGTFPPRRRIGERAVAWLASEVIRWMRDQPVAGRGVTINPPPRGRPRKVPQTQLRVLT